MVTYSSSSLVFDSTTSFHFLLDFTGPCFMHCLGASGGLGSCSSVKGNVDLSFSSFKKLFGCYSLFVNDVNMGEFWSNFGGRWDSLSFSKLLKECRVIGINGEVIVSILTSMVLPSGGTVPVHFQAIVKTTI